MIKKQLRIIFALVLNLIWKIKASSLHFFKPGNSIELDFGRSSLLLNSRMKVKGRGNLFSIGEKSTLRNLDIEINGSNNKVTMGKGVKFYEWGRILIEGDNCTLLIGNDSTFGSCELLFGESNTMIEIGDECMFSREISLNTSDFHAIFELKTGDRINPAGNVFIDDNVWVGNGVYVNKGAHVGKGSIVASRSVVGKGISAENVIIGGMPGRVLRKGVSWSRDKK